MKKIDHYINPRPQQPSCRPAGSVCTRALLIMHGSCDGGDDEHNGSKAVSLLLRLANLTLALTSAVIMATASSCTIYGRDSSIIVTYKDYPPFVYVMNTIIVQTSSFVFTHHIYFTDLISRLLSVNAVI